MSRSFVCLSANVLVCCDEFDVSGPGESGKSTVFKQMKIIQDDGGFTKEELQGFRHIVHANCISQMRVLVQAAARQRQPFQNQENVNLAAELLQLPTAGHVWTPEVGKSIKALWNDSGIRAVYGMAGSLYQLNDTADYFFNCIDRYMETDFCPSVDDVLRVRVRSTGIEEAMFSFEKMIFKALASHIPLAATQFTLGDGCGRSAI